MKNQKMLIGLLVGAVVMVVLYKKGMLGNGETKAGAYGRRKRLSGGGFGGSRQGIACGASGSPSTYQEGSYGCNFMHNCADGGGVASATANSGGSYTLSCSNGGMVVTGGSGNPTVMPTRR